jgi:hypothetical protein
MTPLARARCRVTGHTGDWALPDAACIRVRVCQRCGDVTRSQEHTWSASRYLTGGRCEQERRCERCRVTETRVLHQWGPWRYTGPDSLLLELRQQRFCGRCGTQEQADFERAF